MKAVSELGARDADVARAHSSRRGQMEAIIASLGAIIDQNAELAACGLRASS